MNSKILVAYATKFGSTESSYSSIYDKDLF